MRLFTPRMCRNARNLLKWNIRELATRSGVTPGRLQEFEKLKLRLFKVEVDALLKTFTKNDVIFNDDHSAHFRKTGETIDPRPKQEKSADKQASSNSVDGT